MSGPVPIADARRCLPSELPARDDVRHIRFSVHTVVRDSHDKRDRLFPIYPALDGASMRAAPRIDPDQCSVSPVAVTRAWAAAAASKLRITKRVQPAHAKGLA